mmetsp:Transcript_18550/g.29120  ORF Transcript_18550/g.29120 Transcript_18550/m.29120 type:complete len:502 (-) Transcript_18550:7-1512(-)
MGCTQSTQHEEDLSVTERMGGRRGIDKSERIHSRSEKERLAAKRSKVLAQTAGNNTEKSPPKLNAAGHLVAEEVAKRITGSIQSKETVVGDVKSGKGEDLIHVRYAALTQRGYYPENPHKENQDDYYICGSKFGAGEGDAFFAVFDGHGDKGHDCARFAKKRLPAILASKLKKQRAGLNAKKIKAMTENNQEKPKNAFHPSSWPYLNEKQYEDVCRQAHIQCNKEMHDDKKVKDFLSGTTAISVGFHAGRMTVSNVGDSRAVLGYRVGGVDLQGTPAEEEKKEISSEDDIVLVDAAGVKYESGSIIAIPLSDDQTPYRRDERKRLKKAGARILTIDQLEGRKPIEENVEDFNLGVDIDEEGDMPRVYCQDHDYPGTAFSRSLGDFVAEDIGVNGEPEILTKKVTKGDEIVVIASDGVFEFLTNQRMVDICAACDDPLHACTKLLEASYEQWLNYELRTDDISCIVLFLQNGIADDIAEVTRIMNNAKDGRKIKTIAEASTH